MSWELTRFVLSLRNLRPTEKAVAHSLAYHAPKNGSAYPSMETIALEAGLGNRTAAQKVVRRLEAIGIISPTSSKKGGRNNPTRYRFNLGNSIPADALSDKENSIPEDANLAETASLETRKGIQGDARDKGDKEAVDSSKPTTAAFSEKQMEECIQMVSTYYLEAFDRERIVTPSEKQMARARLLEVLPRVVKEHLNPESVAGYMTCAIDVAHHIVRTQPQKKYFSQWFAIFGKQRTFASLIEQHGDLGNVPPAAEFPEDRTKDEKRK